MPMKEIMRTLIMRSCLHCIRFILPCSASGKLHKQEVNIVEVVIDSDEGYEKEIEDLNGNAKRNAKGFQPVFGSSTKPQIKFHKLKKFRRTWCKATQTHILVAVVLMESLYNICHNFCMSDRHSSPPAICGMYHRSKRKETLCITNT